VWLDEVSIDDETNISDVAINRVYIVRPYLWDVLFISFGTLFGRNDSVRFIQGSVNEDLFTCFITKELVSEYCIQSV
jgi:hypothetical protein